MAWSLVDKSLVIQTLLYFGIVVNGLASVISALLSKNGFKSLCILYGEATCLNETSRAGANSSLSTLDPDTYSSIRINEGQLSVCHFIVAVNILVCVFYGLFNAVYHAHCAKKSAYQIRVGYQMWTKVLAFSSFLSLVLVMSSACMVTVGLSKWCKQVMEAFEECDQSLDRCSDTQHDGIWLWTTASMVPTFNPAVPHYLDLYEITETTCWINVALWLIHIVMYIHRMFRQRYVQTSYQEPFTADFLDAFT